MIEQPSVLGPTPARGFPFLAVIFLITAMLSGAIVKAALFEKAKSAVSLSSVTEDLLSRAGYDADDYDGLRSLCAELTTTLAPKLQRRNKGT